MSLINQPTVQNLDDSKLFLQECIKELGRNFHPDNDFSEYTDKDGHKTFESTSELNIQMDRCLYYFDQNSEDIYEYCMSIW